MQTPKRAVLFFVLTCTMAASAQTAGELHAQHRLEAAAKQGAPALYALLKPFPKGADLHMHFSGAVYAETFIANAVSDNLCLDPVKLVLTKDVGLTKSLPPQPVCAEGNVAAAAALKDQALYDRLINSFSMRSFVPYAGFSAHDQFFATFDHFSGIDKSHQGAWLAELTSRAGEQNEQYLEIMTTPSFSNAIKAATTVGWPAGGITDANHLQTLAGLRKAYLNAGLRDDIAADTDELARIDSARRRLQSCDVYDQLGAHTYPTQSHGGIMQMEDAATSAGCGVKVHWLYQVLRGFSPQQVFAQTLLGFELASAQPEQVVGINFVRAEDRRDAMTEYHTEMLMLDYLHSVYPAVHISLHAGELAPGLVPPDGLTFHIREAIELGHAERIGHGVDVLYESNLKSNGLVVQHLKPLLEEMAAQHTMVEINLTSNDVILGVKGVDHPLAAYRAAHVPWALSTDDEGVSRIDLTHEYVRGVLEQHLDYRALKESARNSLQYSFLRGRSLWQSQPGGAKAAGCPAQLTERMQLADTCTAFLATNEKASAQFELEVRLQRFESTLLH